MSSTYAEPIARLEQGLDELAAIGPDFRTTAEKRELLLGLSRVIVRAQAEHLRVLAVADDIAVQTGARSTAAWLADQTREHPGTLRRHRALATALDERWTQTAAAFAAGQVNLTQTRIITEALTALPTDLGEDLLTKAETLLLSEAAHLGPRDLKTYGTRILASLAPDIAAHATTRLTFHPRGDGATDVHARLRRVIHDQGRVKRLFEGALRIALNLVFPTCTALGCTVPRPGAKHITRSPRPRAARPASRTAPCSAPSTTTAPTTPTGPPPTTPTATPPSPDANSARPSTELDARHTAHLTHDPTALGPGHGWSCVRFGSACAGWWCEVVTGDHIIQPRRVGHLEAVFACEGCDLLGVGRAFGRGLAHSPEEVLEACWADHLDHPGRKLPRVPHGVGLTTRFGDVAAGTEYDFSVARSEADLAFGHDGVFVLPGVKVRRHTGADRERMLDDRHEPVGLLTEQLEDHPDGAEENLFPFAWLHDCQFWCLDTAHETAPSFAIPEYSAVLLKRPPAESWCQPFV